MKLIVCRHVLPLRFAHIAYIKIMHFDCPTADVNTSSIVKFKKSSWSDIDLLPQLFFLKTLSLPITYKSILVVEALH